MKKHDIVIVGGGPAGMMAGLLFARAGLDVVVLEKHGDFLRDFRGDTVHPSTLDLFDELGLLDALLAEPHDKVAEIGAVIGGRSYRVADFSHLPGRGRFVAMMPQWHFLDFVAREARRFPTFGLRMETEAVGLLGGAGRVAASARGRGGDYGAAGDPRGRAHLRSARGGRAAVAGPWRADRRLLVPRAEGARGHERDGRLSLAGADGGADRPWRLFPMRPRDPQGQRGGGGGARHRGVPR